MNFLKRIPNIVYISVTFFFLVLALITPSPVGPLIINAAFNNDSSKAAIIVGVTSAISSLLSFFVSPVHGILSDRYGRKPFLIISVFSNIIGTLGSLIIFMAPSQYWVLFLTNFISGSLSSIWGMSFSYVADITTAESRARYFGIIGAAAGLALVLGPAVGGVLGKYSLGYPLLASMIMSLVNCLFIFFLVPESLDISTKKPIQWRKNNPLSSFYLIWQKKLVLLLSIVFCLNQVSSFGIMGASVLYYRDVFHWGSLEVGLSLSEFGLVSGIAQGLLIKPATQYIGEKATILLGLTMIAIAAIPYGLVSNGYWLFAFIPIKAIASVHMPILQGVISKQYDKTIQGKIMGVAGSLQTLSGFIGPLIFTSLFSYFSSSKAPIHMPEIIFYVSAGLEFIAVAIAIFGFRYFPMEENSTLPEDVVIKEEVESLIGAEIGGTSVNMDEIEEDS